MSAKKLIYLPITTTEDTFFINEYERVFTVRLLWNNRQPIVFGTLEKIVKYALKPNKGIEGFYEVAGNKLNKVSKKELKEMLGHRFPELGKELFKKY